MYYPVVGYEVDGFSGPRIVAVSDSHGPNGGIYTSFTGLTDSWTEQFSFPLSGSWGQLAFGGPGNDEYYLVVSNDQTQVTPGFPAISRDGVLWTQGPSLPTVNGGQIWSFPIWVEDLQLWLMLNAASEKWVISSADGLNWATLGNRADGGAGIGQSRGIAYFDGAIVVVGTGGNIVRYSLDNCNTWNAASGLTVGYQSILASQVLNKLVICSGGKIALATDPASWSETNLPFNILSVADDLQDGNQIYVTNSSTQLYTGTSPDGTMWTQIDFGPNPNDNMFGPLFTLNNNFFGWSYAGALQCFVAPAITGPYSANTQPNPNFNRVVVARR